MSKAEHYPVVGAALLWTLEKGLGDGWTPEVADAWSTAYGTLSGYMISEVQLLDELTRCACTSTTSASFRCQHSGRAPPFAPEPSGVGPRCLQ
jgi:hypothetical protein